MKKVLVVALAAAGLVSSGLACAGDTGWMVRARAVNIDWDNSNSSNQLGSKVEADNLTIPEIDVSYFFTKNVAAELVLTVPQLVDIKLGGTKLGTIGALPPSLMLQYHFTDMGAFKPYVGAGVNYTLFLDKKVTTGINVDDTSMGLAAQVGFDYALTKNVSLNFDVKYIKMGTDVKVNGTKMDQVNLSPITAGVGIGYRF